MRTLHDDLTSEVTRVLLEELDPGDLQPEDALKLFKRASDSVFDKIWEYIEDYKIDSRGNFIFEYGMLKHLLVGEK